MKKFLLPAIALFLLAPLSAPALSNSLDLYALYQTQSRNCTANMQKLGMLLKQYADAHDGQLPAGINMVGLAALAGLPVQPDFFVCPSTRVKKARSFGAMNERNNSYIYMGNVNLNNIRFNPEQVPLLFDKPGTRHLNVLFRNGRIATLGKFGDKRHLSVRSIIDALSNEYNYPLELAQQLRIAADAIDQSR